MATQSITFSQQFANMPANVAQAVEAAGTLAGQTGRRRIAAAVALAITNGVRRNPQGGWDVDSRSGGRPHRVTSAGCDCQDAKYNAPVVLGKRACSHQIAVWIVIKAGRLASTASTGSAAEARPETPVSEPVEPLALTLAGAIAAAGSINGTEYELVVTHIGGHDDAAILRAVDDPQAHESYLVDGDWREDSITVRFWGARWGEVDTETTRRLASASSATAGTPSLTIDAGDPQGLEPAVAYYLETTGRGIKVMTTRGEAHPRPVRVFNGADRLTEARAFARTRAEATCVGLRHSTPAGRFAVANSLLPAAWRQRMGGSQVGKAWVVFAQAVEQSQQEAV